MIDKKLIPRARFCTRDTGKATQPPAARCCRPLPHTPTPRGGLFGGWDDGVGEPTSSDPPTDSISESARVWPAILSPAFCNCHRITLTSTTSTTSFDLAPSPSTRHSDSKNDRVAQEGFTAATSPFRLCAKFRVCPGVSSLFVVSRWPARAWARISINSTPNWLDKTRGSLAGRCLRGDSLAARLGRYVKVL